MFSDISCIMFKTFSDLGLYHDMDTVDKLNFYTENKEWKVMMIVDYSFDNEYSKVDDDDVGQ